MEILVQENAILQLDLVNSVTDYFTIMLMFKTRACYVWLVTFDLSGTGVCQGSCGGVTRYLPTE